MQVDIRLLTLEWIIKFWNTVYRRSIAYYIYIHDGAKLLCRLKQLESVQMEIVHINYSPKLASL